MQRWSRLKRELKDLSEKPLANIGVHSMNKNENGQNLDNIRAQIIGSKESVYAKAVFELEIVVPERYPLVAPVIRFLTPVYHPNIDKSGRICLSVLTDPTQWKPSMNLAFLLLAIQSLLDHPNAEDSLQPEIASIYKKKL